MKGNLWLALFTVAMIGLVFFYAWQRQYGGQPVQKVSGKVVSRREEKLKPDFKHSAYFVIVQFESGAEVELQVLSRKKFEAYYSGVNGVITYRGSVLIDVERSATGI